MSQLKEEDAQGLRYLSELFNRLPEIQENEENEEEITPVLTQEEKPSISTKREKPNRKQGRRKK